MIAASARWAVCYFHAVGTRPQFAERAPGLRPAAWLPWLGLLAAAIAFRAACAGTMFRDGQFMTPIAADEFLLRYLAERPVVQDNFGPWGGREGSDEGVAQVGFTLTFELPASERFHYRARAPVSPDGSHEIRLPVPGEAGYQVSAGGQVASLRISESDVREGRLVSGPHFE